MHVLMFSDNVSVEEENELKEYAVAHNLLMMGPDCGTAIVNGVALRFANVVRKGNIGLVAASGITDMSVTKVCKAAMPFIVLSLLALLVITYVPDISLWLPRQIYGTW